MRTSVGKASANALGAFLKQSFAQNGSGDVTVYSRWPNGPDLKGRVISIIPVGNRVRDDSYGTIEVANRVNLSATTAQIRFRQGDLTQPLQLDVWCRSDDGRDDILAQLDDILHQGLPQTLNVLNSLQTITGDPVNDELSLPLAVPFDGDFATYQFDEESIDDTPDSIQRCEYRATFLGQARMPYSFFRTVPRLIAATMKIQATATPGVAGGPVGPFVTTTLNAGNPPTKTHGTSNS